MVNDARMQIITEMMQERVQSVSSERVAVYYKRLRDLPEEILKAAIVSIQENSSTKGVPSVAEIRNKANEIRKRTSRLGEPVDDLKDRTEHQATVSRLRKWNYSEHVITSVLMGSQPCPTEPKRFTEKGLDLMKRLKESDNPILLVEGVTRAIDDV